MTADYRDHPENLDKAAILDLNRIYDERLPPLGARLFDELVQKACYIGASFSGCKGLGAALRQRRARRGSEVA